MCTIRVVKPISVVNKLDYQELVTPVPELGSTTAQESITAQGALSIKPGSSKPKVGLRPELLLDSKTSSLLSLPFSSLCPTSPHFPVARDTSIVIFFIKWVTRSFTWGYFCIVHWLIRIWLDLPRVCPGDSKARVTENSRKTVHLKATLIARSSKQ